MKGFVLFFFLLICKLLAFRTEGAEAQLSPPSAIVLGKENAKQEVLRGECDENCFVPEKPLPPGD